MCETFPEHTYPVDEDHIARIPQLFSDLYLKRTLALYGLIHRDMYLLFHSSLLVRDDWAYLFFGDSGAGKTTIAEKLGTRFRRGSDEANIVLKKECSYVAYATPFTSFKEQLISPGNVQAPLKRVFLLEKEYSRPSWKEKMSDRDLLWKFLVTGQTTPPKAMPSLYAKYGAMVNTFANECEPFILHHNLSDDPEMLQQVIADGS